MFLEGLLGIFQICFLPGLVILAFFNLNTIDRVILSFPISLITNYALFYSLTLLGWYTKDVVMAVVIIELVLLVILYTKYAKNRVLVTIIPGIAQPDWELPRAIKALFMLLALIATGWLFFKIINMVPSNFHYYDDVCNWNRWAVDWFRGMLPVRTWEYPQLLPLNWSLSYKLLGTYEYEYFVTAINGLIALYVLGAFWGMYFDSRRDMFLVAVPVAGFLLCLFVGPMLGSGMADIPSAFFGINGLFLNSLLLRSMLAMLVKNMNIINTL